MAEERDTKRSVDRLLGKSLLQTNPLLVANTTLVTDVYGYAVQAIEDTIFDTGTAFTIQDGLGANATATLITKTLKAGHVWYIPITAVKLVSGSVIIYRDKM